MGSNIYRDFNLSTDNMRLVSFSLSHIGHLLLNSFTPDRDFLQYSFANHFDRNCQHSNQRLCLAGIEVDIV